MKKRSTRAEETVCDLGGRLLRIAFKPGCRAGESCFQTSLDSIHQAGSFKLCGPGAEIFSFQRSGAVHFVMLRTGKELASIATNPFTMFCNESSAFVIPMHEPPQRRILEKYSWGRADKTAYVQVGDRNRFNPPFALELVNNDTLRLKDGFGSLDFVRVSP